jgi:hypothetical protein
MVVYGSLHLFLKEVGKGLFVPCSLFSVPSVKGKGTEARERERERGWSEAFPSFLQQGEERSSSTTLPAAP